MKKVLNQTEQRVLKKESENSKKSLEYENEITKLIQQITLLEIKRDELNDKLSETEVKNAAECAKLQEELTRYKNLHEKYQKIRISNGPSDRPVSY